MLEIYNCSTLYPKVILHLIEVTTHQIFSEVNTGISQEHTPIFVTRLLNKGAKPICKISISAERNNPTHKNSS
jgi:hypothetical protein